MKTPTLMEMLQAGAHFGHQISRWHPKMKPFIYTERNGIHIINLEVTQKYLTETLDAVKGMAATGQKILFVTTKPQAKEIVKAAAIECEMPYLVERWLGGLLTNFTEIKRLLKKYISLKEQQKNGELEKYTKQEQIRIGKEIEKMDVSLAGLASLEKMPDAIFLPALQREKTAVTEANKMRVPVIGVCDTNSNPDKADYVIPANDDAVNSIKLIVNLVAEAVKEGRKEWEQKQGAEKAAVVKKKVA